MNLGVKAALAAAAATAAIGLVPATAPAATTFDLDCFGKVAVGQNRSEGAITYDFGCTQAFAGYSIVTFNRQIDSFDTEVVAYDFKTGEAAAGEEYSCIGAVPARGLSCNGKASGGNRVRGALTISDDPCLGDRPEFGLVVTDSKGSPSQLFDLSNSIPGHRDRPFNGCPKQPRPKVAKKKPNAKSKPKSKAHATRLARR